MTSPCLTCWPSIDRIPGSSDDGEGAQARCLLGHTLGVGCQRGSRIEGDRGGDTLGHVARRDHPHRDRRRQGGRLSGGQHGITIVGQHDDLTRAGREDAFDDLAHGRPRAVTGRDHMGTQRSQHARQPRRPRDRDHGRPCCLRRGRSWRLRRGLRDWLGARQRGLSTGSCCRTVDRRRVHTAVCDLLVQVGHLHLAQAAPTQSGGDGKVGSLAVDMDAHKLLVAGHHHRVTDCQDGCAQRRDVDAAARRGQHVLRLVAVGCEDGMCGRRDAARVGIVPGRDGPGRARRAGRAGSCATGAAFDLQHALQHAIKPLAARIDDAGVGEYRQQHRRAGHGARRRLDDIGQHGFHVWLPASRALGRIGSVADDREDSALDRRQHRFVGHLRTLAQTLGQVEPTGATASVGAMRHAPDDLREDDATVATSAGERTTAQGIGHRVEITSVLRQRLGSGQGRAHRGQHVRAGVTIGHGEDVERVDLVDMSLEIVCRRRDRADEGRAIDVEARHQVVRTSPGWGVAGGWRWSITNESLSSGGPMV